jgi:hypothetical protein
MLEWRQNDIMPVKEIPKPLYHKSYFMVVKDGDTASGRRTQVGESTIKQYALLVIRVANRLI